MVARMRTDFHARRLPSQPFGAVHQRFDGDAFGFVPIIRTADLLADGVTRRAKTVPLQNGQGVREIILVTVIERNAEDFALFFAAAVYMYDPAKGLWVRRKGQAA